ncbi:MAG: DUF456 domain-containing protein [Alistipes sp.]|nr:DUF456 domain-containing protein [Alistipes sp.]
MDLLLTLSAVVLSIAGIAGCIVPAIPGPAVGYAGLLCASLAGDSAIGRTALLAWAAAAAAVSVADFYLPAWMTRRFGGSRAGAVGATVGILAGFFLFPPLGILLGPFAGAVAGELLHDRGDLPKALRVGMGSFLAFAVGTGLKFVATMGMTAFVVADIWSRGQGWFGAAA